jgi:hypothetical protein
MPASQLNAAPPDCVGAACRVMLSYGGKTMTPGVGSTAEETMPGISLVPDWYMASPSRATPVPNMPAQASMTPVTTGVPAPGRPARTLPATCVKSWSGGSFSAAPGTRARSSST